MTDIDKESEQIEAAYQARAARDFRTFIYGLIIEGQRGCSHRIAIP